MIEITTFDFKSVIGTYFIFAGKGTKKNLKCHTTTHKKRLNHCKINTKSKDYVWFLWYSKQGTTPKQPSKIPSATNIFCTLGVGGLGTMLQIRCKSASNPLRIPFLYRSLNGHTADEIIQKIKLFPFFMQGFQVFRII